MASTKPNRAYPSLPGAGAGTALLEALREAVEIHERRTNNKLDSFVRLGELVELGVLSIQGDQILSVEETAEGAATVLSVLGRSVNSAGERGDIAASANDQLLRRTGDTLNFGQLTAGMFPNTVVPDAALSSNVPLLNAANTFTAVGNLSSDAALVLASTDPGLFFYDTNAAADTGKFRLRGTGAGMLFQVINDAEDTAQSAIQVVGVAGVVTSLALQGTAVTVNGLDLASGAAVSLLGRSANSAGARADITASANDRLLRRTGDTLNFGQLTAGMFPATLSIATDLTVTDALRVRAAQVRLNFEETGATADEGYWQFRADGDEFHLYTLSDVFSASGDVMKVTRTGTAIDEIEFNATLLDFNGIIDSDQPIALGGGAAATLGTIGGSGPTTAAQAQWLRININGTGHWIPVWT